MSATCTGDDASSPTTHTCVYTAGSSLYGSKYMPTDQTTATEWGTPITDATGYAGGWIWVAVADNTSTTSVDDGELTLQAGRMFPKLEKKEYKAADLRFSADVTGKIGSQLGTAAFIWEAANWAGAAQVASVAAAAAVVALTF
jgi:hypothetical protein